MQVLFFVFAAFFFVLALVSPRRLWWWTSSWMYRNPEAAEPSDAVHALSRVALIAAAIAMLVLGMTFPDTEDGADEPRGPTQSEIVASMFPTLIPATPSPSPDKARVYSRSEVRKLAEQVASGFQGVSREHLTGNDVIKRVQEAGDGNVRIAEDSEPEKEIDKFELTNIKGKHPFCLIAKKFSVWITSVSVDSGRC